MLDISSGEQEAAKWVSRKIRPICFTDKSLQNIGQFITVKQHQKSWGLSTESLEQKSSSYKWNHFHISNIRIKGRERLLWNKEKWKGLYLFIFKWPFPCPFCTMFTLALPLDRLGKMLLSLGGKKNVATCKPLSLGWKSSLKIANSSNV